MSPEEIKKIRESMFVTQEKFAQLLGTTVTTVNRWENGKVKPSRIYIREIKEIASKHGSYIRRREEFENS